MTTNTSRAVEQLRLAADLATDAISRLDEMNAGNHTDHTDEVDQLIAAAARALINARQLLDPEQTNLPAEHAADEALILLRRARRVLRPRKAAAGVETRVIATLRPGTTEPVEWHPPGDFHSVPCRFRLNLEQAGRKADHRYCECSCHAVTR